MEIGSWAQLTILGNGELDQEVRRDGLPYELRHIDDTAKPAIYHGNEL